MICEINLTDIVKEKEKVKIYLGNRWRDQRILRDTNYSGIRVRNKLEKKLLIVPAGLKLKLKLIVQ